MDCKARSEIVEAREAALTSRIALLMNLVRAGVDTAALCQTLAADLPRLIWLYRLAQRRYDRDSAIYLASIPVARWSRPAVCSHMRVAAGAA